MSMTRLVETSMNAMLPVSQCILSPGFLCCEPRGK